MLVSTDGNIYSEDDINWHYSLTPEGALWVTLQDAGIIEKDFDSFNFDMYHDAFTHFMDMLVKLNIVSDGSSKNDE